MLDSNDYRGHVIRNIEQWKDTSNDARVALMRQYMKMKENQIYCVAKTPSEYEQEMRAFIQGIQSRLKEMWQERQMAREELARAIELVTISNDDSSVDFCESILHEGNSSHGNKIY